MSHAAFIERTHGNAPSSYQQRLADGDRPAHMHIPTGRGSTAGDVRAGRQEARLKPASRGGSGLALTPSMQERP